MAVVRRRFDRLLRFVAASAVFHVLGAPASDWVRRTYVRDGTWHAGRALPWGLWICLLAYLVVPYVVGTAVGARTTGDRWSFRLLKVPDPPTAWDYFFSQHPAAAEIEQDTGDFVRNADGSVALRDERLLVAWDDVEYLEFIDG